MASPKKLLPFFAFLALAAPARAKPRSGILSTDFDGTTSGSRYIGMGEAGVAASGMPESPLWNPAGLEDLTSPIFSADFDVARHSSLADDVLRASSPLRGQKLTYLGFTSHQTGFFFRPLTDFDDRTITDPADPANNFTRNSVKVNQFGLSASQAGESGSAVGVNLSYLNGRRGFAQAATGQTPILDLADGNGFTIDLGARIKTEYFSYGLAFFNVPGVMYWNAYKPDQLPVQMRGLEYRPVKPFGFEADYEKRFYRGGLPKPHFLHLGLEMDLFPWLAVRGGTFGENLNDTQKTSYTGGFSVVSPKQHRLDFALRVYKYQGASVTNTFLSIILPIPETKTEK